MVVRGSRATDATDLITMTSIEARMTNLLARALIRHSDFDIRPSQRLGLRCAQPPGTLHPFDIRRRFAALSR